MKPQNRRHIGEVNANPPAQMRRRIGMKAGRPRACGLIMGWKTINAGLEGQEPLNGKVAWARVELSPHRPVFLAGFLTAYSRRSEEEG